VTFRTKLLCLVTLPVAGLVAVGGLAATDSISADAIALTSVATALVSIAAALVLTRRVARPLQQLTEAAGLLATDRLPALIDGIATPSEEDHRYLAATIQPIEVHTNDEIGQLASAFNSIQTVAVDAAAQQAGMLRKGIGDLFVNLARRNQVLLDRQIEMFDELEALEEDPAQRAKLYRLDHVATRMRRNAESLLVLAGVESTRPRTKAVSMRDVVHAAIGEIEDFTRVEVGQCDELQVQGAAAVDLGHLLAELLENATQLSAPDTRVLVEGRTTKHGYAVSLTDSGVGMRSDQMDEANDLLASPPPVGLAIGRTLGFTVVARLAARHNVIVRLAPAPTGGTVAVVSLPSQLVVTADAEGPHNATREEASVRPATEPAPLAKADFDALVRSAWSDEPADTGDEQWIRPDGEPEPLPRRGPQPVAAHEDRPASLSEALPEGRALDAGLDMLMRADELLGPAMLVEPAIEGLPDVLPTTAAGLVRRVRSASPPADPPRDTGPPMMASKRSPEEVRSILDSYREGLRHGQAGALPLEQDERTDG
jgi:signal transduction histidine kinase